MKTASHLNGRPGRSAGQQGSAVIVVLAFLAIMLLYVGSNLNSLAGLHRELKLVEHRQLRHWETAAAVFTNAAVTNFPASR